MSKASKRIITPFDDLTYKVIGCAMAVHRALGSGYRENTYQRDLAILFSEAQLSFESQKLYEIYDSLKSEQLIGYYIPDFVIEDALIVEIKALKVLDNSHLAQVIGYLAVTGFQVGLLINFGERSLKYRRILPPKDITEHRVNHQWLFVPDWLRTEQDSSASKAGIVLIRSIRSPNPLSDFLTREADVGRDGEVVAWCWSRCSTSCLKNPEKRLNYRRFCTIVFISVQLEKKNSLWGGS